MSRAGVNERLLAVRGSWSSVELIEALEDPSPAVIKAAAARLAIVGGPEITNSLRARLLHTDLSCVGAVATTLHKLADASAVDTALAGLHEDRYTFRMAAARALKVFADPHAAPALRAALRDPVAGVRAAALDALAALGASDANASACVPLLEDSNAQVRLRAISAIARMARRPGRFLSVAAGDSDSQVRIGVARFAASLPPDRARILLTDQEALVREAAARGAGTSQLDILAAVVRDDASSAVRLAATQTLGELGDPCVANSLLAALGDRDDLVRVAALRSLMLLLTPAETVRRLHEELRTPTALRRRAAVYALARLVESGETTGALVATLGGLVEDPDVGVRLALVHTAAELQPDPQPMLAYLVGDMDPTVRHAAELQLWRGHDRGYLR